MIYIVLLGVGFKCPRKIHLNTQCVSVSVCVCVGWGVGGQDKKLKFSACFCLRLSCKLIGGIVFCQFKNILL